MRLPSETTFEPTTVEGVTRWGRVGLLLGFEAGTTRETAENATAKVSVGVPGQPIALLDWKVGRLHASKLP